MSKKTSYLLGILLTIIIGTFFYWKLCCSCNCKTKKEKINKTVTTPKPKTKEIVLAPFGIKDVNNGLLSKMEGNYLFDKSKFIILDSLSKDVSDGALLIKEYLDKNSQKRFDIMGHYTSEEENTSPYPNLGLARANAVKNYMASKGISTKTINTYGKLDDDLKFDSNNIVYKSIKLGLADKNPETASKEEESLKSDCAKLKENPLVLNFKTSEATINLTTSQREKFSKITECVDKLGSKIQIIGHTDNTCNSENNMILGQNRADFAKQYLISNGGINSNNIYATSKGDTSPISDNSTPAGRAKNRRTVITIK